MGNFDMPPEGASFEARGGWLVRRLMQDLAPLTDLQAAGIVGNFGGESGLDPNINEVRPMVPGSRGGFGWEQATGDRRIALEEWAREHGIDFGPKNTLDDDEANYGFLIHELLTTEARALRQLRKTTTLEAAVYTFEVLFERPSNPEGGLAARVRFAERALAGYSYLLAPARVMPDLTPTIKQLQLNLQAMGLYGGKIDGDPGPRTIGALGAYREQRNGAR